jgi:hypothetical protein
VENETGQGEMIFGGGEVLDVEAQISEARLTRSIILLGR